MDEQSDFVFYEEQKFSPWVHFLMVLTIIFEILIFIIAFKTESGWRFPPERLKFLLTGVFIFGIPIVIEILFIFLKLETGVRHDCLYVRMFPLHIHFKKFYKSQDLHFLDAFFLEIG